MIWYNPSVGLVCVACGSGLVRGMVFVLGGIRGVVMGFPVGISLVGDRVLGLALGVTHCLSVR